MYVKIKYTKEQVENAVLDSKCFSDVFRYLNIKINGGSYKWIKRLISKYELDVSHFLSPKELFKLNHFNTIKINYKGVKSIESPQRLKSKTLKRLMLDNGIQLQCRICKLTMWLDEPITLDIDHMDGNCLNNKVKNLQFLCPNCHRQKTQNK